MTPAEQLAAARQNVVGPYLPAKAEWLDGWCGPVLGPDGVPGAITGPDHRPEDERYGPYNVAAADLYGWEFGDTRSCKADELLLDVHRPEVRDHLVRLGCPEWARDVPAAVWCWGMGVEVADVAPRWNDAADLAALNAGCILREPGGWLVPMPDGGIGFFPEVSGV